MRHKPNRRAALTTLALLALAVAALLPALATAQPAAQSANTCADLLDWYHAAARSPAIAFDDWGDEIDAMDDGDSGMALEEADFGGDAMAADGADELAAPQSGGDGSMPDTRTEATESAPADLGQRSETGTNVQVAGVDESDIVKTNGAEIFVLRDDSLVIVSTADPAPSVIGGLRFGSSTIRSADGPREMLLAGDRLLLFRSVAYGRAAQPGAQIVEVDVSAPARPRILRTLDTYGSFVTARLVGDEVRVVLTHDGINSPRLMPDDEDWWWWDDSSWREAVERTTLSTWLPIFSMTDRANGRWRWGRLAPCSGIRTTDSPDPGIGTETTLLLNFDLSEGIGQWAAAGVVGSTDAVYASTNSVYVAMSNWRTWSAADTTIHRWDLSGGDAPSYRGEAVVAGQLINQFAMSEYDGHLRVASTRFDIWPTTNLLTVFEIEDDALSQLAVLEGLGPSESIYAVRFLGALGYVVTFRQIDPLYVLNLSDPAAPAVAGELKIPGFSAYLHPLGGGLLLGIGQNADERTGRPLGLQASLFDVSDPTAPTRLSQVDLSPGSRSVTFEHRAFTYHQGRAYIPASPTNDLFAVRVTPEALELENTVTAQSPVLRSLPIQNRLHLLLEASLATHDPTTLELLSGVYLVPPPPN